MLSYLHAFFNTFAYETEDAAYLCEVYTRITQNEEAHRCLEQAMALYEAMPCDHAKIVALADDIARLLPLHEYTTELLVYICLSRSLHERYRARGIEDEVFVDTLLDLRYKLEECKAVKGVIGSFVASWFAGFFDMTRFALGRLQFEIISFGEHYEKDGKVLTPDSAVINVHIPRTGTPLDQASCEEAYRRAALFFADKLHGEIAFVCYSWLLYPENATILPTHSNIVRFASQYDIVKWGISKDKVDLWRLFDTDEQHPDRLPVDTTARRRYVEHIKRGGKLGWGYGVFFG